jgi:ABC-type nitrate/sulfonate/bicarbonate transport system substrate-binding protein
MKKGLQTILTIAIVVLLGVLLTIIIVPTIKQAQPSEIKILVDNTVASFPVQYAYSQQIFKTSNVKIEATVEKIDDPQKGIQALISGEAQFAVLPWPDVLDWLGSHTEDTLLCVYSAIFKEGRPQEGLFPRKGLKFNSISDLEGKKVGVTLDTKLAIKAVIRSAELDPDKIEIKVYPTDKLLNALESGEVDLILPLEPYYSQAKTFLSEPFENGALLPKWITSPYHGSGLFTTASFMRQEPKAIVRMYLAMNYTIPNLANKKNADTTEALMQEIYGFEDPQIISRINLPEFNIVPNIEALEIQELSDRLEYYGAIKHSANLEDLGVLISKEHLRE